MKLEKDDLDAITAAVIAGLKAEGATIGAAAAPATKPAGKGKPADKPADKPAEQPQTTAPELSEEEVKKARAALLAKVKDLGAKTTPENAKSVVGNYAPLLGQVEPKDFAALDADLDAALNAAAEAGDGGY